jgi:ABC-type amino acid transport substrate-binding protein/cytochrome c553
VAGEALRVCADPDNLPFSKAEGPEKGLYVELAEKIAARLGSEVRYVWWLTFNERKALRNTILADECDLLFALPSDPEYKVRGVLRTHPFLELSNVVVGPSSFAFARLDDLKGKRVAVQFGTVPQLVLATHDGLATMVTFKTGEEAMAALDKGEADLAFIWGPVAGYQNLRHYGGRFKLTPVTGEGLGGQVAVVIRKGKEALLAPIEQALAELRPEIAALADKYGFPRKPPVTLARGQRERLAALATVRDGVVRIAEYSSTGGGAADAPPAKGDAAAGRVKFNDSCSHCHSVDGASPLHERDLRRLRLRYEAKWPEVALKTIKDGRPELGMPTWKDALRPEEIANILAFFGTIQK